MLKRIAVKDIKPGMFICEFCGSWMEYPFGKTHFLLKDDKDFQSILNSGIEELWIDTAKGLDLDAPAAEAPAATSTTERGPDSTSSPSQPAPIDFDEEIQTAIVLCEKARKTVTRLFEQARLGKVLPLEQARHLVDDIILSVARHPQALISLVRLKQANDYTYMHSVAVCALMIALARQLQLDEEQVREAGFAGLLHDVGKVGIPLDVLNKPGNLTEIEFSVIKTHPEIGARILMDNPQVSAIALDVCLHHHEKVDGTGYPHGLTGETLSIFAKMAAVCDVYDALTSNRPYKKAAPPAESIRNMAEWSKSHFDERVFQAFVKTVGIYPTGSLVKLESDRLAVVIEQNRASLLTPVVKVFFSAKTRMPILHSTLDLAALNGSDRIVSRESPDKWGFKHLDRLWAGLY